MNNPYQQFNIRPRANHRLQADQTNTPGSSFESFNLRNRTLGTVRLVSPTVASENQRMYNAVYSNAPHMPLSGFNAVGQTAHGQWLGLQGPQYMTNYNPGIMPVNPVDVGNQPSGFPMPTNVQDAARMRMNTQQSDLLQQYMSGYAAVLGNRMTVPQVVSVQQTALPGVAVIPSNLDVAGNVNIPFREVQWVPPGVQQTGIPQVPYALEIKPDNDKTPNSQVPFGNLSGINAASTVVGSNYRTEHVLEHNAPTVYLDIAMDRSSNSLDANSRPVVIPSIHREVAVTDTTRKPVKRKRNQSGSTSVNISDKRAVSARIRPCVVSLVPIDSIIVSSFENNKDVEEDSVDSISTLSASPVAETQELEEDSVDSISTLIASPVAETQELEEDSVDSVSTQIDSPVAETQELSFDEDTPVRESLDAIPELSSQELTVNLVADSDKLIGSDEDVGDDDNYDMPAPIDDSVVEPWNGEDIPVPVMEVNTNVNLVESVVEENADRSDLHQLTGSGDGAEGLTDSDRLIGSDEEVGGEDDTILNNPVSTGKNTNKNDSDQLIGSDEDVGGENDNCVLSEDCDSEKSVCYEVMHKDSDTVLFDMECDGDKDGETLRVLLPTKKRKTTTTKTAPEAKTISKAALPSLSARMDAILLRVINRCKPTELPKNPTSTVSNVVPFDVDKDTSDDDVMFVKSVTAAENSATTTSDRGKNPASNVSNVVPVDVNKETSDDIMFVKSVTAAESSVTTRSDRGNVKEAAVSEKPQRLAASACKEKISAAGSQLDCIELRKSDNSLLGVPLQCSFFRFETRSSEVFRLLSMDKSYVPDSVLAPLMNLVSSVDTTSVSVSLLSGNASSGAVYRIPQGGRRTVLFQCLFCPYGELSAKRVMTHVKQQHRKHASFIQRRLLPSHQVMLFLYCRHCNFIGYDSAALLIHFAVYHKVPGILLSKPRDIEQDPDWVPAVNPESRASVFPFYCCPNCIYIDVEWNRVIQHMLKMHYSESVYMGCIVHLIMIGRASKHLSTFTYASLAKNEDCKVARKDIYACVSCRFFSFYPTYAFCHYVANHGGIEMLYMCAASPTCTKRYTCVDEVISHIQDVHVAMRKLRFQCTVTLLDGLTSTELDIGPGELNNSDVPLHVNFQSPSVRTCRVTTTIEIVDDDDSDDDVMFLGSEHKDIKLDDDVEPDDPSNCCDVPANTEPIIVVEDENEQEPSDMNSSSQEHPVVEKLTEDQPDAEQVLDLTCEADRIRHVEQESLKTVQCDPQTGKTEKDIDESDSQSVEKAVFMCLSDLVDSVENSERSSLDADSRPACDAAVTNVVSQTVVSSSSESSAEPESTQSSVEGTCQTDNSVEDSTSSTTDQPADVADLVSHAHVSSNDQSVAQSESMKNPVSEPNETRSIKDATFTSEELEHRQDAAADLVNHVGIPASDDTAEGLVFNHTDLSPQEPSERNAEEDSITNPQLNDSAGSEQELFNFDQLDGVDLLNDSLSLGDTLPNFEPSESSGDQPESREYCAMDVQEELLLLAEQLTADEPWNGGEISKTVSCSVAASVKSAAEDTSDCSDIDCMESDDTFCNSVLTNEQLNISFESLPPESNAVDDSFVGHSADTSRPSTIDHSSKLPSESIHSEVSKQTDSVSMQGIDADSPDKPVSGNQSRFKSLAGFRFPSSCSVLTNPKSD